jgi:hypothetical protein
MKREPDQAIRASFSDGRLKLKSKQQQRHDCGSRSNSDTDWRLM